MPGGAGSGGSVRGGKKIGDRIRSTRFEMQTSGGNAMRGLLERKKAAAESRMEARKQLKAKVDAKAAKAAKAEAKAAKAGKSKAGGADGGKKTPKSEAKPSSKPTKATPKGGKKAGAAAAKAEKAQKKADALKAKTEAKAARAKEKAAQELKAKLQALKAPKTTSELRQTIERGTSRAIQAALAATTGAAISMAQRGVGATSQAVQ